jgi:hypothetical protein
MMAAQCNQNMSSLYTIKKSHILTGIFINFDCYIVPYDNELSLLHQSAKCAKVDLFMGDPQEEFIRRKTNKFSQL